MHSCDRPIAVFDSGLGGISVLRELVRQMPQENYLYFGDSLHAPYGSMLTERIRELTFAAARMLFERGAKALVIACNTATSAAIQTLRERLSIPVVGMEPALKPAYELHADGKILVLATPATLRQAKFHRLYERYGEHAVALPCPELVEFVESGRCEGDEIDAYLARRFADVQGEKLAAAVLGCTHFSFLKRAFAKAIPGVPLIDGNEGTARRLEYLLRENGTLRETGEGSVEFFTSGDEDVFLPLMRRLFAAR